MTYKPEYCVINREECSKLLGCSGTTVLIYNVLSAYAMKDKFAYPSHQTIKDWLKAPHLALSTISRSLARLENLGIIKRGHQRSKERYEMTWRRAVQFAKGVVSTAYVQFSELAKLSLANSQTEEKREKKKNIYIQKSSSPSSSESPPRKKRYKPKKKKSISHWFDFGHNEETPQSSGERIFSRLVALSPTLAPSILTEEERRALYLDLSTPTKQNEEWINWATEVHGTKLVELKRTLENHFNKESKKKPPLHYEGGEINSLSF